MKRTPCVVFALVLLTALSARGQTAPPEGRIEKPQAGSPAVARVRTNHIDIRTRVSNADVTPGVPFALVLDITPRARMHVYAPGATNYRAIELAMTPLKSVAFPPVQFPPAEIYEFVPLNERIPVYQKPFQLIQPAVVAVSSTDAASLADGENLTIQGTLSYQACDDRICFSPASVPLKWTVTIKRGGL